MSSQELKTVVLLMSELSSQPLLRTSIFESVLLLSIRLLSIHLSFHLTFNSFDFWFYSLPSIVKPINFESTTLTDGQCVAHLIDWHHHRCKSLALNSFCSSGPEHWSWASLKPFSQNNYFNSINYLFLILSYFQLLSQILIINSI